MTVSAPPSNFAFLQAHDEQLVRLGLLAEQYFAADPNTCLIKLRQYGEVLAQLVAANTGLYSSPQESQADLLYRLRDEGILPPQIAQIFGELRRTNNAATHNLEGDHRTALAMLKLAWQLGVWFHRTFTDPGYKSGPFIPPTPPGPGAADESEELRAELARLNEALAEYEATHGAAVQQMTALEQQLRAELRAAQNEGALWEQLATESEAAKLELAQRLAAQQAAAAAQSPAVKAGYAAAAGRAAAHGRKRGRTLPSPSGRR